jgi:acetyl-CoA carboxylase biotin carboxyl carrier protein
MDDVKITHQNNFRRECKSETTFNKCQLTALPQAAAPQTNYSCCSSSRGASCRECALYHYKVSKCWDFMKNLPDKPMFVEVGKSPLKVMFLCVIEAMKLFNEIESKARK